MSGRIKGASSRLGYLGDTVEWKLISEAYYWDKVTEAYERALEVGAVGGGSALSFFRLIEGEAQTRKVSQTVLVAPWLHLETQEGSPERLPEVAVEVCSAVADRLGWNFEMQAMVTVLVPEADAPWHGARYGYCIDKYPFDKVCLPSAAQTDEAHFRTVLAHEYAHVVTLNVTQDRAPQWVQEGVSRLMEGASAEAARRRISRWLAPEELDNSFGAERRFGENRTRVGDAYDQACVLVDYLQHLKGDEGLARFLRFFSNHSLWEEIKARISLHPEDEALRSAYGMSIAELFREARS